MGKVKVKTIYNTECNREPNISEYQTREQAEEFIRTCKKWGIGIFSCEVLKPNKKNS